MGSTDVGEAVEYFGHGLCFPFKIVCGIYKISPANCARLIFFADGVADADVADD